MILLIAFAFLAGIITILSPCILPVLPIILSSSVDTSGKKRPFGVVMGFILSFTFFTLFLSTIVRLSGISADYLRYASVATLIIFGLSLFIPTIQLLTEQLFSKLTRFAPNGQTKHGFFGGLIIGLSLGLLWTPCVGPILASVISLAIVGNITFQAFIITLAYSLGTAIPMFIIMQTGSSALQQVPWLLQNSGKIQKAFGVLMVLTAIGIFFNFDRQFQTYILNVFPQYGAGLTKFEDNVSVKSELKVVGQQAKGLVAPEIIPGGVWFNPPLPEASLGQVLKSLRGKVVIVDFWTYSCINCQRTLPYLRRWWDKYHDKGLVIIGVHSPEFEFEKSEKNLAQAIKDFQINYPVVQDNDFATWRAYANQYWPAKYFIDKDGLIRYTHFGEGGYDESEKIIQDLLKETGVASASGQISNPQYQVYAKTPEIYLGHKRTAGIGLNPLVELKGNWDVMEEYATPKKGAKLLLNFESKEVFLVMRSKSGEAKVKVYLDDLMQDSVIVNSDKLYQLISLPIPGKHLLRLEFEDDSTELYAFTFG